MEALILKLKQGIVSLDASADNFGMQLVAAIEENDKLNRAAHDASLGLEAKRAEGFRDIVVAEIVRRKSLAAVAAKDETFKAEAETAFLTGPEITPDRLRLHYERTPEVESPKAKTTDVYVDNGDDQDPYTALGVSANTSN